MALFVLLMPVVRYKKYCKFSAVALAQRAFFKFTGFKLTSFSPKESNKFTAFNPLAVVINPTD